jgi:hypothetical protein
MIIEIISEVYFVFDFPMMDVLCEDKGKRFEATICCHHIEIVKNATLPFSLENVDYQLKLF